MKVSAAKKPFMTKLVNVTTPNITPPVILTIHTFKLLINIRQNTDHRSFFKRCTVISETTSSPVTCVFFSRLISLIKNNLIIKGKNQKRKDINKKNPNTLFVREKLLYHDIYSFIYI